MATTAAEPQYGLKQPVDLSYGIKMQVEGYIAALDTPAQKNREELGMDCKRAKLLRAG